jgi:hypothetical protein
MKRIIVFILFILSSLQLASQDSISHIEANIGADFVSRYVWRGSAYSTMPSIQPSLTFSYKGLELGTWGSYSFNGSDGAELDFFLSYTLFKDLFTICLTDYYFPNDQLGDDQFFNFHKDETGHIVEMSLSFNGNDKIPISLLIAANIFGDDARRINDNPNSGNFNNVEGIQYSSYIEIGYNFYFGDLEFCAFAGLTPNKPKEAKTIQNKEYIGESGYYGHTRGFVNIGLNTNYNIPMSENYGLPVFSSLIVNPMAQKIFLVFGLTI